MIPINEVFISPQGEGIKAGLMTLFIRVSGCSYAVEGHPCSYCDTRYAWYKNGKEFSVEKIQEDTEETLLKYDIKEVVLTGGEPLMYSPEINPLIHWLSKRYSLSVETNGGHLIWKENCCWSLDTKCPSSNNAEHNLYQNLEMLAQKDQVKFVISNRDDFNFASSIVKSRIVLTNVVFQPAWKLLLHAELIEWVKDDRDLVGVVRIGDQLQKRWYRKRRGV